MAKTKAVPKPFNTDELIRKATMAVDVVIERVRTRILDKPPVPKLHSEEI